MRASPSCVAYLKDLEEMVRVIKLEVTKDEKRANIVIGPGPGGWPLLPALIKAFAAEGQSTHFRSPAAAGWMEDEMATWLDALR